MNEDTECWLVWMNWVNIFLEMQDMKKALLLKKALRTERLKHANAEESGGKGKAGGNGKGLVWENGHVSSARAPPSSRGGLIALTGVPGTAPGGYPQYPEV